MSDNDTNQTKLGDGGTIDEPDADLSNRHDDLDLDDFGNELGQYDTKGGFNKYNVTSALQKAVRRSDPELAAFCAWELTRSGYGWNFWQRAFTIAHEDLTLTDHSGALPTVSHLFDLWKGSQPVQYWGNGQHESRARMCCLKAAVVMARAESGRETEYMNDVFKAMRDKRIATHETDEEVPEEISFPDIPDVALDMHTYEGKKRGRDYSHFLVSSSRVDNMTDLAKKYKDLNMRRAAPEYSFARGEHSHGLSEVDDEEPYDEPGYRS